MTGIVGKINRLQSYIGTPQKFLGYPAKINITAEEYMQSSAADTILYYTTAPLNT